MARNIFGRRSLPPPSRRQRRQRFVTVLGVGLLLLAALSVAAGASPWTPLFEAFGNLQLHFAVASAVLALAALFARSPGLVLLGVAVLGGNLVSAGVRVADVDMCTVEDAAGASNSFRLMTHNVQWRTGRLDSLETLLVRHDPDIAVLQEVWPSQVAQLSKLKERYPHQIACQGGGRCGVAILSKFPAEYRATIDGEEGFAIAVHADVTIGARSMTLIGAHMDRPFELDQFEQFEVLGALVGKLPAETAVAGDFNSVAWSTNLSRFAEDAGVCVANATLATWPKWLGPFGIPIDHVFLKSGLSLDSIEAVDGVDSDHKALIATLNMR